MTKLDKTNLTEEAHIGEELDTLHPLFRKFKVAAECVADGTFTVQQAYDLYLKLFEPQIT